MENVFTIEYNIKSAKNWLGREKKDVIITATVTAPDGTKENINVLYNNQKTYIDFTALQQFASKLPARFGGGSASGPGGGRNGEPSNPSPTPSPTPSCENLTEEQKIFIATIAGESIGQGSLAWEAVGNVIMNRIGVREWSKYSTATDVIKNTGFDGYGSNEYKKAMEYLNNRTGDNQLYENLINTVMPVHNQTVDDITGGAQLFYSPRSMPNGRKPNWNFTVLTEITVEGINANDFRFYKYK